MRDWCLRNLKDKRLASSFPRRSTEALVHCAIIQESTDFRIVPQGPKVPDTEAEVISGHVQEGHLDPSRVN